MLRRAADSVARVVGMTIFAPVPGVRPGRRFSWLVVVPTAFAFGPWVLTAVPHELGLVAQVVLALLPLAGVAPVLAYRWLTRERVLLLSYLPYALAATAFAVTMVDLIVAIAREPNGAFIPVVPFTLGFFQPALVVVGGIVSFVLVDD